jgi:hypothetical protein
MRLDSFLSFRVSPGDPMAHRAELVMPSYSIVFGISLTNRHLEPPTNSKQQKDFLRQNVNLKASNGCHAHVNLAGKVRSSVLGEV